MAPCDACPGEDRDVDETGGSRGPVSSDLHFAREINVSGYLLADQDGANNDRAQDAASLHLRTTQTPDLAAGKDLTRIHRPLDS